MSKANAVVALIILSKEIEIDLAYSIGSYVNVSSVAM